MAAVLKLENYTQTASYDFLTGTLKPGNNTRRTSPIGNGLVSEGMVLTGTGTDAAIRAAVQTITEMAEAVRVFWDEPNQMDTYWWREESDSETAYGKRSLIHSIAIEPLTIDRFGAILGKTGAFYNLVVIRESIFEAFTTSTVTGSAVSCLGGTVALAAIPGSYSARINQFNILGASGGGTINRVWAGIRPTLEGTAAFEPLWELENGTYNSTAGAALATDTNASPRAGANNCVQIAVDTASDWVVKMTIDQATATTSYHHFAGQYLVLLRYKLGAANEVILQMRTGYSSSVGYGAGELKATTSTAYRFMELGFINIPPFGYRYEFQGTGTDTTLKNFQIQIWAYRTGAAVTLTVDCIVLIPVPHFTYSEGSAIAFTDSDSITWTSHRTTADGKTIVLYFDTNNDPVANLIYTLDRDDFVVPVEGGLLVIAGEETASQVVSDNVDLSIGRLFRHRVHAEDS